MATNVTHVTEPPAYGTRTGVPSALVEPKKLEVDEDHRLGCPEQLTWRERERRSQDQLA